ncbi:aminopeptidase [Vagococcus coleopterorum]|uniref:Aminopeptidase n=1 Tax=Vagococcus coleopterorum TaxID=2714946 RepID=A0A6G8AM37_9ENTE|nr:aminopeptidase [Vagococcus coleopterorum]QIL46066.1 aminopeptidase [Vagococcus coleopterorum]
MSTFDENLKKYAELIVENGVNVMEHHTVVLQISVNQAQLARLIVEAAYAKGADQVIVKWNDDEILRETVKNTPKDVLAKVPAYVVDETHDWLDKGASRISVISANPDALGGLDPEHVAAYQSYDAGALADLRKASQANKISWTVVAASEGPWAAKVFPELATEEEQVAALWDQIFKTTRVYADDPVVAWKEHKETLGTKADMLNKEQFDALHYTAPGTDLTIGLPKGHIWVSAGSENARGEIFTANMPTEEVFTAPDCRRADGYVSSTKPLSYGGNIIEGMKWTFKDGEVVDVTAEKGEEVIKSLVASDAGSKRLGEVALVSDPSPISQSGIVFFNTLFDENASNHLAVGAAYAHNLQGGTTMSEDELIANGINRSQKHVDFMIGSAEMNVDGIREDGTVVPIFRNGDWA